MKGARITWVYVWLGRTQAWCVAFSGILAACLKANVSSISSSLGSAGPPLATVIGGGAKAQLGIERPKVDEE